MIAAFAGLAVAAIAWAAPGAPASAQSDMQQSAPAPRKNSAAKPAAGGASLEARHQVCLSFIRRHELSCDPWVEPTCGADTGYFRPPECVRPRSQ